MGQKPPLSPADANERTNSLSVAMRTGTLFSSCLPNSAERSWMLRARYTRNRFGGMCFRDSPRDKATPLFVLVLFTQQIIHSHNGIDVFRCESRLQTSTNLFSVYRRRSIE